MAMERGVGSANGDQTEVAENLNALCFNNLKYSMPASGKKKETEVVSVVTRCLAEIAYIVCQRATVTRHKHCFMELSPDEVEAFESNDVLPQEREC
jgi:hypothetical protein